MRYNPAMGLTFDFAVRLSDVASWLALLVSGLALLLNWLTRREQKQTAQPLVRIVDSARRFIRDPPPVGWTCLTVSLRSRDNQGYACKSLRITSPRRAQLATIGGALTDRRTGNVEWRQDGPTNAAREIPLKFHVMHAGKPTRHGPAGVVMEIGDSDHREFLASVTPGIWARLVSALAPGRAMSSCKVTIAVRISRDSDSREFTLKRTVRIAPRNTTNETSKIAM